MSGPENIPPSQHISRLTRLSMVRSFLMEGRVDTSETNGRAATRLIVGQAETGQWTVPLVNEIQLKHRDQSYRIEDSRYQPNIQMSLGAGQAGLILSWTDHATQEQTVFIDISKARYISGDLSNPEA